MRARISICINCGEKPVIVRSDDDEFPYMLKHDDKHWCYSSFKLISYQRTVKECIDDWNAFNTSRR